jgi:N-acyl-D-aspartate/D-glutamate deacylase
MIVWLVRDEKKFSVEEIHKILSDKPAQLFGFKDRGRITESFSADLMIYDYDKIGFSFGKYSRVDDLPGKEWALVVEPSGILYTIVAGEITHDHGMPTGAKPGKVVSNSVAIGDPVTA